MFVIIEHERTAGRFRNIQRSWFPGCARLVDMSARWNWRLLVVGAIDTDAVMYEALDIAMAYLVRIGRASDRNAVQAMAASVILSSYGRGVRNRIRLANEAIVALEAAPVPADVKQLQSFFPRLVPDNIS